MVESWRSKLWDWMVWVLIYFPLFTGGVWYERPGLFLELSELAVPVLIVAFFGALFHFKFRDDLSRTSSLRLALRAWTWWNKLLTNQPKKALFIGSLFFSVLWSLASLRRHWALGSGVADLGIFTNAIWNLTHGGGYISSVKGGMNLFADHQSPIFWLLVPFYKLFPHAETLLIAQGIGLALGAVPLYYIGKQYLGRHPWAAALPLLYWSYLPVRTANAFDFHPEVFMLPLFLAALAGLQSTIKTHRAWGLFGLILALGGKESAGLVACGIGAGWLLGAGPELTRNFTRKMGLALIPAGLGVFYFDTRIVPKMMGVEYAYNDNYKYLGSTLTEIVLSPFSKPRVFWSVVFGITRIRFFIWAAAPLAFIPLLNWRAILAAVPAFAILFLSEGNHRVNPIYHYGIEPAVGLLWAMPGALLFLSRRKWKYALQVTTALMIFFCLFSYGRSELFRIRANSPTPRQVWIRDKLLPCLTLLPTAASGSMVPHIADRHWANHLPRIQMPEEGGAKKFVDCVVYDPEINNWPLSMDEYNVMMREMMALGYKEVYHCGSYVYQLSSAPDRQCLQCTPACNP